MDTGILKAHLWKEWREQRWALGALALVCVAAPIALAIAARSLGFARAPFAEWTALCSGVLAAVLLGSDLVPREVARRGTCGVALMARLSGAAAAAFTAKVAVFVIGIALCTSLGFASGWTVDFARAVDVGASVYGVDFVGIALVAGAAVPWIFAASTLVVRGIWSVPLGLVAGLGIWGVVALGGVLTDSAPVSALFLALNAIAALVVAWFGFVRGHASGPAPRRAALLGGATLGVFALPTAALGGSAAWQELSVDPNDASFEVEWFVLVEGGERVLVQGTQQRRHPSAPGELFDPWLERARAFEFDLATGAWTALWERNTAFEASGASVDDRQCRFFTVRSIADGRGAPGRVWDARERCFVEDDAVDAEIEATIEANGVHAWESLGRGIYESGAVPRSERIVVDPDTGHRVALRALASGDGAVPFCVLVRDGRWVLAFHPFDEALRRRDGSYSSIELYDPTTGERERAEGVARLLGSSLGIGRLLPDGRLVGRDGASIVVFDPEAPGDAVAVGGFAFEDLEHSGLAVLGRTSGSESATALFMLLHDGFERRAVARLRLDASSPDTWHLDVVELEDRTSCWNATVIGADRLLFQTRRDTIVEVDFVAGTARTVFPVER